MSATEPTSPIAWSATMLVDRLRRFYIKAGQPMPGGVFAHEVGENGGFGSGQRCDAVYAGFTSSSGRILIGHEVKVSRADWQHELDQPAKADRWSDACHEWWVVAPSTKIVEPATIPAGWGLMVPSTRGTVRFDKIVTPTRRPHDWAPPWWAVRSFMARQDTLARQEYRTREYEARRAADAEVEGRVQTLLQQAREGGTNGEGARAIEILQSYRDVGVELDRLRDYAAALSPEALAPFAKALVANHTATKVLKDLQQRWSGVATVVEQVTQLSKAVADLEAAGRTS